MTPCQAWLQDQLRRGPTYPDPPSCLGVGVPGQAQHPEVLRWQSRLRRLCSSLASAPCAGVCHPGFPLWVACLTPRVTSTAGAQGATSSPGWGCRGEKLAGGLAKELQKPRYGCPADPGPFQKPLVMCDKGRCPCGGWKWICGSMMEQCRHIAAQPCLWGMLLELCHRFPGNSKALFGREISWHCWEQAVGVETAPRDRENVNARGGCTWLGVFFGLLSGCLEEAAPGR